MKNQPVILQCGILTALGDLKQTWNNLMDGQTGLAPFGGQSTLSGLPVGRINTLQGDIGTARRLSNLLEKGLTDFSVSREISDHADIIVATTKAAVDELINPDEKPLQAQPWNIGSLISQLTGCHGNVETVSAACASGTLALIKAGQKIITGESKAVLVVGVDILSEFVVAGFASLKALSPEPCKPFDRTRDGLSLGEGVGFILVAGNTFSKTAQSQAKAELLGWGVSSDARHITAPCRQGSGLLAVIQQATRNGQLKVGAINAHGTGTSYNDAMELTAFQSFWQQDIPPFHSVKGAIGHCVGGAGVIEAAIAVESLHQGKIPPTVGLQDPENCQTCVSNTQQHILCQTILSCNSGFGGINAGILLKGTGTHH